MKLADREDLLLAIRRLFSRNGRSPVRSDLAAATHREESEINSDLNGLAEAGEIAMEPDGSVSLTPRGEEVACQVMRKHKVLESFLEEMLGMDREAAHQQACTLEHIATEETISRLGSFIKTAPPCLIGYRTPSPGCEPGEEIKSNDCTSSPECVSIMLSECREGDMVSISAIKGCGRASRLADLGVIPGEKILVRRLMAKTLLIQVKGCDIALSSEIATTVLVERC